MARWRKWLHRGPSDWWLLLRTGLLLLGIRTGLFLFSFKRMLRLVARAGQPARHAPPSQSELARLIWAVSRMSQFILSDAPCLTQALALQILFGRRGVATDLRIGVAREESGGLEAHAWVEREGKVVIGGANSPELYTPLPSLENISL